MITVVLVSPGSFPWGLSADENVGTKPLLPLKSALSSPKNHCKAKVLKWQESGCPDGIRQCIEIFLFIIAEGRRNGYHPHLVTRGQECPPLPSPNILQCPGQPPQKRTAHPKMLTVPKLGNSNKSLCYCSQQIIIQEVRRNTLEVRGGPERKDSNKQRKIPKESTRKGGISHSHLVRGQLFWVVFFIWEHIWIKHM